MSKKRTPTQLSWAVNASRAENHRGLISYAPDCVRVRCRRGDARVLGQELALREVRKDALIVTGRIDAVELAHDPAAD